ncbi:unnamed protein product [Boreogadus saida]
MLKQDFRCLFQTRTLRRRAAGGAETLEEPRRWRSRDAGGAETLEEPRRWRSRDAGGAETLEEPRRWRSRDAGGAETLEEPRRWRSRDAGGAETLEEPRRWRSRDAGGAETLEEPRHWRTTRNRPTRIPHKFNVFLERRRAGRGAVNLEDDITLPTRILRPDQESGGLMEKPYIWKANPEDNQDSTIKDSSHT